MKIKVILILLMAILVPATSYCAPPENDGMFINTKLPGKRGAHSHRSWSNAYLGISVGGGFPMSDYGKADTVDGAGYAKIGVSFNGTGSIKIMPFLGAIAMVSGTLNGYDAKKFGELTNDTLGKYLGIAAPTYSAKPYYIGKYLIGGFVYFTDGENFDISVRILAGLATVKFPFVTGTSSSPSWTQEKTYEIPNSKNIGYDVGVGINYKLAGRLGLLFNIDYFGTNVKYSDITESTQVKFTTSPIIANSTYIDTRSYVRSISLVNVSAGISLNF